MITPATTRRADRRGRIARPARVGLDPCPEGQVRSWDYPHECGPASLGRRILGGVVVVSGIAFLLGLFAGGAYLAAGAARGIL